MFETIRSVHACQGSLRGAGKGVLGGVQLRRQLQSSIGRPSVHHQSSSRSFSTKTPSLRQRIIETANDASLKPYQVMAGVALGGLGATLGGTL